MPDRGRTAPSGGRPEAGARPVTPSTIAAAELTDICNDPALAEALGDDVAARLTRVRDIIAGLDPYLDRCTTASSAPLDALASRTADTEWGDGPLEQEMLSGHVEGRFLQFLVGMTGATNILEIGMFTGYSALAMAEEVGPGGTVTACELDESVAAFARSCFDESEAGDRIEILVGPADRTLQELADAGRTFDLVFVDADKGGYQGYLDTLLQSDLLAPGAVIAVDNTLLQGEPYLTGSTSDNGRAIAEFNDRVAADPRVDQVMLPLRDGLTIFDGRLECQFAGCHQHRDFVPQSRFHFL